MYYYKTNDNNEIVEFFEYVEGDVVQDMIKENFIATEKEIVCKAGKYYFSDDVTEEIEQLDLSAREQQQAEMQAQAEEEALKPTVEDLAEALDILTGIVLGGEE